MEYAVIAGSPSRGTVLRLVDGDVRALDRQHGNGQDQGHGPQYVVSIADVEVQVGDTVDVDGDGCVVACDNQGPKRYRIYPIADADCTSVNDGNLIGETDDLAEAERMASEANYPFGAAITDTETGLINFGAGFGTEVSTPEA